MAEQEIVGYDLFGQPIVKQKYLRDDFIEPPFSVLDTKGGNWVNRKEKWKRLGIKSELGRDAIAIHIGTDGYTKAGEETKKKHSGENYVSIFDPVLCELMYKWFVPEGGTILDPFAGGSVRGIVANYLGYHYTGIELRQEQVDSNREQAMNICEIDNQPQWYCGDSNQVLDGQWQHDFDFVFTCPPYADLEVYSDKPEDLSNMDYDAFNVAYASILKKAASKLKKGGYAAIVVGEVRRKDDKEGAYLGLVPMTINHCMAAGLKFYNEAILLNPIASASMRAAGNMKTKKLVKIHQNVLIFKK